MILFAKVIDEFENCLFFSRIRMIRFGIVLRIFTNDDRSLQQRKSNNSSLISNASSYGGFISGAMIGCNLGFSIITSFGWSSPWPSTISSLVSVISCWSSFSGDNWNHSMSCRNEFDFKKQLGLPHLSRFDLQLENLEDRPFFLDPNKMLSRLVTRNCFYSTIRLSATISNEPSFLIGFYRPIDVKWLLRIYLPFIIWKEEWNYRMVWDTHKWSLRIYNLRQNQSHRF